ncbi:MAG: carbohydrate ABC transporter permease [Chthoniobacterales bacterium]
MSFFSPITARSPALRWIYGGVYAILIFGAVTMVLPLLVSLTGSVAGNYDANLVSFFPRFLHSPTDQWRRYLDAKYSGTVDYYSVAHNQPALAMKTASLPAALPDAEKIKLWKEFLQESPVPADRFLIGFTRPNPKEAAYYNRQFVKYLLKKFGSVDAMNEKLNTLFAFTQDIVPPLSTLIGPVPQENAFGSEFIEFEKTIPIERKIAWNAGSYFRNLFVPQQFGFSINAYNTSAGTHYKDFSEISFSATVPHLGKAAWYQFVSKAVSPRYIELTPEGEAARVKSGLSKANFIRSSAKPEQLVVNSPDLQFSAWAAKKGIANAQIPQVDLDYADFLEHRTFWIGQFLTQNYVYVLDGVVFQGTALMNTIILIILTVGGALIVNPLAAYALSRFKLKQSYTILLFFLLTIAFPAEVTLIPNFLMLKELNWMNTFAALVVPGLVNGFSVFLLKGFFDSLPRELYEAAEIDGASESVIFWGITMNLSKPILAVIALSAFTSAYGAFMFALIIAPDPKMWTLMVWIYQLRQNVGPDIVYASVILTALPVLIVFLFAQNIILRGIVVPSEK